MYWGSRKIKIKKKKKKKKRNEEMHGFPQKSN